MKIIENTVYSKFETLINRYLVFLVHVQNSTKISNTDKIDIFNKAEELSKEIYSNVQKTNSNQNEYNTEEKKRVILTAVDDISKTILRELEYYKKDVVISDESLFPINDIFRTLSNPDAAFKMPILNIERLYQIKELTKDKEQEERIKVQLKETKDKLENELEKTKLKAFLSLLYRQNNNPELFYKLNHFILNKCETEEIIFITPMQKIDITYGLYFIISRSDISIKRVTDNGFIGYTVKFTDFEENFNISIHGSITVNGTKEEFTIDETYPVSMRGKIVNTFNLKRIIEISNELYIKHMNKKDEPVKNSDIDDYLTGRIKNT
jgi:hypothetical protein